MSILETVNSPDILAADLGIVFTLSAPGDPTPYGRVTYSTRDKAWAAVEEFIEQVGEVPTVYATRRRPGDLEC